MSLFVRGGGGVEWSCALVFKGENQVDGMIRDGKNDQLGNPSTSSRREISSSLS